MKYLSASLALLSISAPIANGLCLKEALLEDGFWTDDPTLNIDDGIPCSLGRVKRVLKNMVNNLTGCGSLNEELKDVFGTGRGSESRAMIEAACAAAPEPSHDATSSFRDILDLDYHVSEDLTEDEAEDRFLKEFYDGNTFINQVVGRSDPSKTVFRQIKSFRQEVAKKEVVSWPSEDIDNFNSCEMNTVMCCWVTDRVINNGDNNGDCKGPYPGKNRPGNSNCVDADPADNTDICYVDMERSPQANHVAGGFILYPDDVEEDTHCHGFVWSDDDNDESKIYKANNLFYVSMEDHLRTRGYVRNVPGAPMCGCLEQMPTVERADCTQTSDEYLYDFQYTGVADNLFEAIVIGRKVSFDACDGETANDLASKYAQMVDDDEITEDARFDEIVVGDNCAVKIDEFLESKGFEKV